YTLTVNVTNLSTYRDWTAADGFRLMIGGGTCYPMGALFVDANIPHQSTRTLTQVIPALDMASLCSLNLQMTQTCPGPFGVTQSVEVQLDGAMFVSTTIPAE